MISRDPAWTRRAVTVHACPFQDRPAKQPAEVHMRTPLIVRGFVAVVDRALSPQTAAHNAHRAAVGLARQIRERAEADAVLPASSGAVVPDRGRDRR